MYNKGHTITNVKRRLIDKLGGVLMRLDKYLKVSRLIKRRTVAKEACSSGKIKVNEKVAKPGTTVAVGDIIEISFGQRISHYEVLMLSEQVRKEQADTMYRIID